MKKAFIVIVLFCMAGMSYSQDTAMQRDIRKLLEMTGSAKLGMQVINYLMTSFKESYPNVPQTFWDEFSKEVNEDGLVKMVVPIYEKYYTHKDIKGLIKFYKSPLGKKSIELAPQLTQDSMQVGEAWGKEISEKALKKLRQGGYIDT